MKASEVIEKVNSVLEPIEEIIGLFGLDTIPGVGIAKVSLSIIRRIFTDKVDGGDETDYTEAMIILEIEEAKEGILTELDRMGIIFDEETNEFEDSDDEG